MLALKEASGYALRQSRGLSLNASWRRGVDRMVTFTANQDEVYKRFGIDKIDPPSPRTIFTYPTYFSEDTRQAYMFTNEPLDKFSENLSLRDASVLCIGSSADFVSNSLFHGAKSVVGVDVSPVGCFTAELKLRAVEVFGYGEFLSFFDLKGNKAFSHDQYERLRPFISKMPQYFFDQLITKNGNSDFLSYGGFIINDGLNMDLIKEINPYLQSEENYNKAKSELKSKSVIFYPQDIREFVDQYEGDNYDRIYLSNIFGYPPHINISSSGLGFGYPVDEEVDYTIQSACDKLTVGGEVSMIGTKSSMLRIGKRWEGRVGKINFVSIDNYRSRLDLGVLVLKKS